MTDHLHTDAAVIAELAIGAAKANRLETHTPAVIVPSDHRIESTEHLQALRSRLRGQFKTGRIQEFIAYTIARAEQFNTYGPTAFIDDQSMTCTALFNVGNATTPGHADDTAKLTLQPESAYAAVRGIEGKKLSQKQLAEWLDDWQHIVAPYYGSPDDDDAAPVATRDVLRRAIRAVRSIEIKEGLVRTTTVGNLRNSASAIAEIEARSAHELPAGFVANVMPYSGFSTRVIQLELSVTTDAEPRLVLRICRKEALLESISGEFVELISQGCAQLNPLIGSYTP